MNLPLHQILPALPVQLRRQTIDETRNIVISHTAGDNGTISVHSLLPKPGKVKVPLSWRASSAELVVAVHPIATSNLLFILTHSATSPTTSRIHLWDDKREETLLAVSVPEPVLGIKTRADKLVLALRTKIVLYRLDLQAQQRRNVLLREGEYETCDNPLGLVALATAPSSSLLAIPGRQSGQVQLIRLHPLTSAPRSGAEQPSQRRDTPASRPPYPIIHIFLAHSSSLRTLDLSSTGDLLCTSSQKGTLLRIFATSAPSGGRERYALIRELRRGTDQADIWSVAFEHPTKGLRLAATSDKGTLHVWNIGGLTSPAFAVESEKSPRARTSSGGSGSAAAASAAAKTASTLLKPYLPAYFSSQWSDTSWRIPNSTPTENTPPDGVDIAQCLFVPPARTQSPARPTQIRKNRKEADQKAKTADIEQTGQHASDILVVTQSGAWFRLGFMSSPSSGSSAAPSANRKPLTPRRIDDRPSTSAKDSPKEGTLQMLEYRRFGYGNAGGEGAIEWSESDEEGDGFAEGENDSNDEGSQGGDV